MSSSEEPPQPRFCGVFFFELPVDARDDEIDIPDPSVSDCYCHPPGIAMEILERSARRRCETCAKLFDIFTATEKSSHLLWNHGILEQVTSFKLEQNPEGCNEYFWESKYWEVYIIDDKLPFENGYGQVIDTGHPEVGIGSHPTGDTGSKEALDLAKKWLSQCGEQHKMCGGTAEKPLPHRILLLEDQPNQTSVSIRLIENSPILGKYACLSHRWGKRTPEVCLTKSNLESFKKGIDTSGLYPMLIEAIHTAHSIGMKYLWIDCLCILQDDTQDWQREACLMGTIYGNAFVTIMGTRCVNGDTTLFNRTNRRKQHEIGRLAGQPVFLSPVMPHVARVPIKQIGGNTEESLCELSNTLLSRGWVYQERHMSNRIIHFNDEELSWECREAAWCECRSNEVNWAERRRTKPRTIAELDWKYIIDQYFRLKLSFDSDRLPALSAIAKTFGESKGFNYIAGMWMEEFLGTFLWHINSQRCERVFPRFAPTWSWASVVPPDNAVFSWSKIEPRFITSCDIEVTPVGNGDQYGHLAMARLTITGVMFNATMLYSNGWAEAISESFVEPEIRKVLLNEAESGADQDVYGLKMDNQYVLFDPDYSIGRATNERGYIPSGSEVVGLIFGCELKKKHPRENDIPYCYGLVLHGVDEDENLYERIGTFGIGKDSSINTTSVNGKWLPGEWVAKVGKKIKLTII